MDKDEIKLYLKDNPEEIRSVLEALECHSVKIQTGKKVQSALPDGDNYTSIHIKLNDGLSSVIYTRNKFDDYEYKDFFSVVMFLKDCELNEAISYICSVCGINYTTKSKQKNKSGSYDFLKKYNRYLKNSSFDSEINETILPEVFTERFTKGNHIKYLRDGISEKTQEKFGISYDILDDRIITPIRNDEGKLVTFKGRTCNKNYKIYGIPKFIYYYPFFAENYLYGLYENYYDIVSANEILVGEAEKFVMQCDTFGVNNTVALSKKVISEKQLRKLLKLGKPAVLMFDKDVTLDEIKEECKKFKNLIDVYYVYDTLDLLKGKESPTDKGIEIFRELLEKCKFKYKED